MEKGAVLGGRFEIERLAGAGGMGTVYRALDRSTGTPVAIKVLRDDLNALRFLREADVLRRLRHPGVVAHVAHATEAPAFLAMEWLEGEDLGSRLDRAPLTLRESLALIGSVADVVAAAHAAGVVHRDLKPSNVFLVGKSLDRVKVIDFGIARQDGSAVLTGTGGVLGTPAYMAPEQIRGAHADARVDVFALGVILHQCIAGRLPFDGPSPMAILAKILLEEPSVLAVPSPVERLLARLLCKDPAGRLPDAAAVQAELASIGPVSDKPAALPATTEERPLALTPEEQGILSVVLARDVLPLREAAVAAHDGVPTLDDKTLLSPSWDGPDARASRRAKVGAIVQSHGGRLQVLLDGSIVVTLSLRGAATDLAARAARCALAIRAEVPGVPLSLATGRAVISGRTTAGQVIDRAASLLVAAGAAPAPILVDDPTARLLEDRFVLGSSDGFHPAFALRAERGEEGPRTLLGRPTPFVGRERELSSLVALFDECATHSVARAVLVTAPAGMGKTRLKNELVRKLNAHGSQPVVWAARGDGLARDSAFAVLGQTIRSAAHIGSWEPAEAQLQKLRARLAERLGQESVAEPCELLAELLGAGPRDAPTIVLAGLRNDPQLLGERMRAAWLRWVEAECAREPVAIVLDDLHWADPPSVKFLDQALRVLADRPLFIVAMGRPEVREAFPSLWAERELQDVRLPGLTRKAAEALVGDVLAARATPTIVQRVVDRAGGNAFYLEELIRAVAEGGSDALPETVLGMVQARFDALSPEERSVLRAGAVFGERFWRGGVLALLGGARQNEEIGGWLEDLARRELLLVRPESRFPAEPEYAFRHDLVREGAYAMLTEENRRLGHRLAAEWLLTAGEADHGALAEHFRQAEEWPRAFAYALSAGDGATRMCAHPEASKRYAAALAALAHLPEGDDRRRRTVDTLLKRIAVTFTNMTDVSLLDDAAVEARALPDVDVPGSQDRLRFLRLRFYAGRVAFYRSQLAEALAAYHEVLAEAPRYGDGDLVAIPAATLGQILVVRGRFAEAAELLTRAEPALRDPAYSAEWILNQAYIAIALGMCGRFEEAQREFEAGYARARAMSYTRGLAEMHIARCLICFTRGDMEGTAADAQAAADHGEVAAEWIDVFVGLLFRAWADSRMGKYDDARATRARSAEVGTARLRGMLFLSDWAAVIDAEMALDSGRFEEAIAHGERALEIAKTLDGLFGGGMGHRVIALASAALGRTEEASTHFAESLRLLEAAGMRPEMTRLEATADKAGIARR
jgi:tetratricopeptide (TPR) repeat protein/predicted Ser/Thr protein kinase